MINYRDGNSRLRLASTTFVLLQDVPKPGTALSGELSWVIGGVPAVRDVLSSRRPACSCTSLWRSHSPYPSPRPWRWTYRLSTNPGGRRCSSHLKYGEADLLLDMRSFKSVARATLPFPTTLSWASPLSGPLENLSAASKSAHRRRVLSCTKRVGLVFRFCGPNSQAVKTTPNANGRIVPTYPGPLVGSSDGSSVLLRGPIESYQHYGVGC